MCVNAITFLFCHFKHILWVILGNTCTSTNIQMKWKIILEASWALLNYYENHKSIIFVNTSRKFWVQNKVISVHVMHWNAAGLQIFSFRQGVWFNRERYFSRKFCIFKQRYIRLRKKIFCFRKRDFVSNEQFWK